MEILTKKKIEAMGLSSIPPHLTPGEAGEKKGLAFRRGSAGLPWWFEVIELSNGEYRHQNRHDLFGKSPDEVKRM